VELEGYLDALASAEPTPGGGSAATLVGALAAALCAMVARITLGAPKHAAVAADAAAVATEADRLRRRFEALRFRDEAAYGAVVAAQALPRADGAQRAVRRAALQRALVEAADAPLEGARLATETFALAARAAELHNANLMSDVDCAVRFARAAFDASVANVEVNHRYLTDPQTIGRQRAELAALGDAARTNERRAAALVAGDG